MPSFDSELFWCHSIDIYRNQEIADLCLRLQNHEGLNVNLMLLCSFLSTQGYLATVETFRQTASNHDFCHWNQTVTINLRCSRQAIAKNSNDQQRDELRRSILAAELQAERVEQKLLISALNNTNPAAQPSDIQGSGNNIINYWQAQTTKAASGDLLTLIEQLDKLV
ncbi:hypothetical protein SIN8267_01979 [Sinobacterium norvegicum]|uniref:TIGR02444 family protein n=1 Tax=Sinobacterium norvegicum TaxID=1641715 RepID=A0ABN8EIJ0_9GAMM|nr:TIGR02444 family protein [Sinobacterium norvegicum]CAH0991864.1 hypothetical protein SIN8267_01979 [Sinobacterium norvegicum]